MKLFTLDRVLTLLTFLVVLSATDVSSQPTFPLFTVNSTADALDAAPGDGVCADANNRCTLRAAVQEANVASAHYPVIAFSLSYPAVISLTLGEINIHSSGFQYYFVGPGARLLTVQRSPTAKQPFRVFNVTSGGSPLSQVVVRMRGLTIANGMGSSQFPGGGVRVGPGAILSLSRSALIGNSAEHGGAAAVEGTPSSPGDDGLNLSQVLVASNSAVKGGAVMVSSGSRFAAVNSTLTNNSAEEGGAVYSAGLTEILNSTVTHNSAAISGSSIVSTASDPWVKVFNSIIGDDPSLPISSLVGSFLSNGNNIITDARGSSGFTNGVNSDQVSDSNAIDPGLGNLADNGGPTDTRALLPGSPAIDAGNACIFTGCPISSPPASYFSDQRLNNRVEVGSAPDIGAVEAAGQAILGEFYSRTGAPISPPGLYYGSQALILDLETGEQTTVGINPFGQFSFKWKFGRIYLLDYKVKRGNPLIRRGIQERG